MESQAASNDKENVNPVSNVPVVEAPKIYTVESKLTCRITFEPFTFRDF